MTKQEFSDLYDSIYYGHDAEIKFNGKHFFIEWSADSLELYSMGGNEGIKIATFSANDKSKTLSELFNFCFENKISINNSFPEIILIDIE